MIEHSFAVSNTNTAGSWFDMDATTSNCVWFEFLNTWANFSLQHDIKSCYVTFLTKQTIIRLVPENIHAFSRLWEQTLDTQSMLEY